MEEKCWDLTYLKVTLFSSDTWLIVWLGTKFLVINNFPSEFLRYYLIFFSHFSACFSVSTLARKPSYTDLPPYPAWALATHSGHPSHRQMFSSFHSHADTLACHTVQKPSLTSSDLEVVSPDHLPFLSDPSVNALLTLLRFQHPPLSHHSLPQPLPAWTHPFFLPS